MTWLFSILSITHHLTGKKKPKALLWPPRLHKICLSNSSITSPFTHSALVTVPSTLISDTTHTLFQDTASPSAWNAFPQIFPRLPSSPSAGVYSSITISSHFAIRDCESRCSVLPCPALFLSIALTIIPKNIYLIVYCLSPLTRM